MVKLSELKPHPRNYHRHPEDQLLHLMQSLREHGVYRNVVVAREWTILAGHGIVTAAERVGLEEFPVIRLDLDPDDPRAIKIMVADNELLKFADPDDRLLSELLQTVNTELSTGLLGTGFDEAMLASLVMVTRPAHEIADMAEAQQWVGMPEFDGSYAKEIILTLRFENAAARDEIVEKLGLVHMRRHERGGMWSSWYPDRETADRTSAIIDG